MSFRTTLIFAFAFLGLLHLAAAGEQWKKAQWTWYTSYAACCKNSPNYNPKASKSECSDFSACKYLGDFAAIGHKSFDWVKSNNIVAFYDNSDPNGKSFKSKYAGKKIKIRAHGKEFIATIADTCGNSDCNGCCRKNSKGGFLLDMESWTVKRNFGSTSKVGGTIEFQIL